MSQDETNEGQNIEDNAEEDSEKSDPEAPSDQEGDSKEKDGSEEDIDYKAELEQERELRKRKEKQLKQAEHTIVEEKKKNKESDDGSESSDSTDNSENIREVIRQEMSATALEDVLASHATSSEEKELIRHHYENTINQSGYSRDDIIRDVRRAKMLANESKLQTTMSEMKQAYDSERKKNRVGSFSSQPSGSEDDRVTGSLTDSEEEIAKRRSRRKDISLEQARKEILQVKAESEGAEV